MTADSARIGVNVAGFLRGGLGLGEAARLYVAALRAGGVPVSTTTVDVRLPDTGVRKAAEFADEDEGADHPFNLICVNAPELPYFYADVGPGFFEGKRSIGVWAWEVDKVPGDWSWSFQAIDEIWVYSRYVAEILRAASPVPVVRMPLPVIPPRADDEGPVPDLPEGFTFLFLFDFYSTMQRKNPVGLIEAFKRAFAPGEGPQLLIKSFNGDYKPERLARVLEAAEGRPDVHVVDRYLTAAEKNALMARCDCYVSLHRAEGYGLTLAEAMALGKPVIATGFSGNTDFMTGDNSYLVRHAMTHVGPEGENYPSDGAWAEPDLDHAAALMREVWEDRDGARQRAAHGRAAVLEGLSVERIGELARERLDRLAVEPAAPRPAPPPPPAPASWEPLQRASWKLAFDPARDAREKGGIKALFRTAALRAMKPYTYHQDELNAALFDGLRELAERLDRLTWALEGQAALDSRGRAHLRRLIEAARARPSPTHPWISRKGDRGEAVLGFDAERDETDGELYRSFEEVFRGDERLIRERQAPYAELLTGADWVLDLGCGRGEFLDLLRERGIRGKGVDLDEGMLARCREKGHDVEAVDALAWLRSQPDDSIPAVFAAQLVEHLPPETLTELLRLIEAKLSHGGKTILETVNPHLPSALKAFWTDPTHHHPLFPEVLLALCRFAGFRSGRVVFPGGTGDFDEDLYSRPDYAVIAVKRGSG